VVVEELPVLFGVGWVRGDWVVSAPSRGSRAVDARSRTRTDLMPADAPPKSQYWSRSCFSMIWPYLAMAVVKGGERAAREKAQGRPPDRLIALPLLRARGESRRAGHLRLLLRLLSCSPCVETQARARAGRGRGRRRGREVERVVVLAARAVFGDQPNAACVCV
jgi:hypothetical protein